LKEDDVKKLAEIRKMLIQLIERTERELELLRACMMIVDEELAKTSFTTAEKLLVKEKAKETIVPLVEREPWRELSTVTYRIGKQEVKLVKIYYRGNDLRIVPLIRFNVSTPPFESFLVNRVLEGMKKRDEEKIANRQLPIDKKIDYEIKLDGDIIKEIIIKNVIEEERVTSIKNAVKWTFTRMYEKYLR